RSLTVHGSSQIQGRWRGGEVRGRKTKTCLAPSWFCFPPSDLGMCSPPPLNLACGGSAISVTAGHYAALPFDADELVADHGERVALGGAVFAGPLDVDGFEGAFVAE